MCPFVRFCTRPSTTKRVDWTSILISFCFGTDKWFIFGRIVTKNRRGTRWGCLIEWKPNLPANKSTDVLATLLYSKLDIRNYINNFHNVWPSETGSSSSQLSYVWLFALWCVIKDCTFCRRTGDIAGRFIIVFAMDFVMAESDFRINMKSFAMFKNVVSLKTIFFHNLRIISESLLTAS